MQQSWVNFGVGDQTDGNTRPLSLSIYCLFFSLFFVSPIFIVLVLLGNTHTHTFLNSSFSLSGCCYSSIGNCFPHLIISSSTLASCLLVSSPLLLLPNDRSGSSIPVSLSLSLSLTTLHYRSQPYYLFIPLSVEGGGLFSASASGYSKGLTLLLSGWKTKERPMKVTPWCQYQQEADPVFRLASLKSRVARGCAAFVCFGSASAGSEASTSPKVGPIQQQDILTEPSVSRESDNIVSDHEDNKDERKVCLKSSLRKPSAIVPVVGRDNNVDLSLFEEEHEVLVTESKKVQWTDASGKELVEIKEFEPSDLSDSDEDYENEMTHTCGCVIT